nr:unnamed protein product [Callosobruchus chinensis]
MQSREGQFYSSVTRP